MKQTRLFLPLLFAFGLATLSVEAASRLTVKAANKLPIARRETLELTAKDLAPLGQTNLHLIHVRDAAGKEVLCQAVDTDFDAFHTADIVIFQADFGPGESKTFTVSSGAKQVYTKADFRAHGRFVRERFDDFAWENDRIAHRMYGKALETWAGEPLTSSTVDIWTKRVPHMVIDGWYMVDNYHEDTGEGADFYSAGKSRGCGGNGLWAEGKLCVSKNFVDSRVLADGPIRVMFELVYDGFDVAGKKVSEVKRITLDAGSNLDHYQSSYRPEAGMGRLTTGLGLKKVAGDQKAWNEEQRWLACWQKVEKNQGLQGVAVVIEPKTLAKEADDKLNHLVLVELPANDVSYWAGFGWDRSGQFSDFEGWKAYIDEFAKRLGSPIAVSATAE